MSLIPKSFFTSHQHHNNYTPYNPYSIDLWDAFASRQPCPSTTPSFIPPEFTQMITTTRVDWSETPESHVLKADLPGLRKDEVQVEVEEGILQISGERRKESEQKTDKWYCVKRSCGKFVRRFRVPENARIEGIKAGMENGVLTVTIPKLVVTSEKKAEVKGGHIAGEVSKRNEEGRNKK